MYILDIKKAMHTRCGSAAAVHMGAAIFCLVFTAVYEIFGYGEHSDSMRSMYLVPLIGGGAVFAVMYLIGCEERLSRLAFNLWNSGIALITSGCLMRGIVEISGRSFEYGGLYTMPGCAALIIGFALQAVKLRRVKLK